MSIKKSLLKLTSYKKYIENAVNLSEDELLAYLKKYKNAYPYRPELKIFEMIKEGKLNKNFARGNKYLFPPYTLYTEEIYSLEELLQNHTFFLRESSNFFDRKYPLVSFIEDRDEFPIEFKIKHFDRYKFSEAKVKINSGTLTLKNKVKDGRVQPPILEIMYEDNLFIFSIDEIFEFNIIKGNIVINNKKNTELKLPIDINESQKSLIEYLIDKSISNRRCFKNQYNEYLKIREELLTSPWEEIENKKENVICV